ncbi:MAG: ATP-binding protein [Erysipelotrichaceae bacterium]|nr:ATP-binding protein [Erysipelotrichaceae bacterium]
MGTYLNPDNIEYIETYNNPIYVDKSLLISHMNARIGTKEKFICVARPRRFGKSTDATMLLAYYSKGCDSTSLFNNLKISKDPSYKKHINKHNIIFIDIMEFYSEFKNIKEMSDYITKILIMELKLEFPNVLFYDENNLNLSMRNIYSQTKERFILILDEWDCVLRDKEATEEKKKEFLEFLRKLFKTQPYVELVYMTGILPIKKYGDESALNMFDEVSMLDPLGLEEFMGFTEKEVKYLCETNHMDFKEMQQWYDGYHFKNGISIYSPRSIVQALIHKECKSYWTNTGTFGTLKDYIKENRDGLKDAVIDLLAGKSLTVNTKTFQNDMSKFSSKDDVLTLLIHLGYLSYDSVQQEVCIPNKEVIDPFVQAVSQLSWGQPSIAFTNSMDLLKATWNLDEDKVAQYIEEAHLETSIIQYNDENALAYTIYFAYIAANNYYTPIRQMPTGEGFADIAYIPYDSTYPTIIVELKWQDSPETAINQIINRKYCHGLKHYKGNILLVGITYNKDSKNKDYKKHYCKIIKASID